MISSENIESATFQVNSRINSTEAIKQSNLSECQMTADVNRQSGYSNPIFLLKTMWHRHKIQSVSHAVCSCRYRSFYSDDSDNSDDLCAQNCACIMTTFARNTNTIAVWVVVFNFLIMWLLRVYFFQNFLSLSSSKGRRCVVFSP